MVHKVLMHCMFGHSILPSEVIGFGSKYEDYMRYSNNKRKRLGLPMRRGRAEHDLLHRIYTQSVIKYGKRLTDLYLFPSIMFKVYGE